MHQAKEMSKLMGNLSSLPQAGLWMVLVAADMTKCQILHLYRLK